jgi:hypothetical protein
MKTLFFLPSILFGMASNPANYYISSSGDDTNNRTSNSIPWEILNKSNSYFTSLNPADNFLLSRGDILYRNILVKKWKYLCVLLR